MASRRRALGAALLAGDPRGALGARRSVRVERCGPFTLALESNQGVPSTSIEPPRWGTPGVWSGTEGHENGMSSDGFVGGMGTITDGASGGLDLRR